MVADFLLIIFLVILIVGAFGINRFKSIFSRLLITSLIDSAALIVLIFALMIKVGISPMTFKLFVVLLFMLLTNPIINHMITRAAYRELKEGDEKEDVH